MRRRRLSLAVKVSKEGVRKFVISLKASNGTEFKFMTILNGHEGFADNRLMTVVALVPVVVRDVFLIVLALPFQDRLCHFFVLHIFR